MSKRVRIFLAALAVGVVAIVVALMWASGPENTAPKVSITLCGYKKGGENIATVAMTNTEACAVAVGVFYIEVEGVTNKVFARGKPRGGTLQSGASTNVWLEFRLDGTEVKAAQRLRVCCLAQRLTLYNKLREKIHVLPVIGSHIDGPRLYDVVSDRFDQ